MVSFGTLYPPTTVSFTADLGTPRGAVNLDSILFAKRNYFHIYIFLNIPRHKIDLPIEQSRCISIMNDSIRGKFGLSVSDGGLLLPTTLKFHTLNERLIQL